MKNSIPTLRVAVLAAVVAMVPTMSRANLTINASYDSTINGNSAIKSTIQQAISWYQTNISTTVTANIVFQNMTSGLGMSSTFYSSDTYANFTGALNTHKASALDNTGLAHLPGATNFGTINFTTADGKALGLLGASSSTDGTISLNTSLCFTGHGSGSTSGYDLYAVACHEIDEVLGISSGSGSSLTPRAVDLFRFKGGNHDLTTGGSAYLSADGTTDIVDYNTNPSNGDTGDWIFHSGAPQVQDYAGQSGFVVNMGNSEKSALDLVGYNFVTTPEPSTWAALGLGAIALMRRRRAR